MNDAFSPGHTPEPPPQNKLERLLREGHEDGSALGVFFRKLRGSEVFAFLPYHPEFQEDDMMSTDKPLQMMSFGGKEEPFFPVFTSLEVAEWSLPKFQGKDCRLMVVSLPAEGWFWSAAHYHQRVIINPANSYRLVMQPEAVVAWVKNEMDDPVDDNTGAESCHVHPVQLDMKPEQRALLSKFCRNHRAMIAVYLFAPMDKPGGKANLWILRVILWVRWRDEATINDFGRMFGKFLPEGVQMEIGTVVGTEDENLAYLKTQTPIWPPPPPEEEQT